MRCFVPEISWHNRDPVYTVDIQPKINDDEQFYRLATGGSDCHVVIWHVTRNDDDDEKPACIEFAADLYRHIKGVNAVRFSPSGELLASGDDDAIIIIWRPRKEVDLPELPSMTEDKEKESWVSLKVLKGHLEDIYDLSWSPDCNMLLSGSVDNTAILWDVNKGKNVSFIGEHKGFVQGVAWDPKNKYLATLCTDRCLRIVSCQTKKTISRVSKGKLTNNNIDKPEKDDKGCKLFHDDSVKTFFRRLTFSPDGELLITPCGVLDDPASGKPVDVSYIFTRGLLTRPAVYLPSPNQYTVAVRCCPIKFKLRSEPVTSLFALPYRYVFAVATKASVVLYDTQQSQPFGLVCNIHYTGLTDLTWSPDGRVLFVSSSEGYCSVITFKESEIGEPYESAKKEKQGSDGDTEEKMEVDETGETNDDRKTERTNDEKSTGEEKTGEANDEKSTGEEETGEANKRKPIDTESRRPDSKASSEVQPTDRDLMKKADVSEKHETSSADHLFKTPKKLRTAKEVTTPTKSDCGSPSQWSMTSQLSLCIDGDEEDLMSEIEQAKRFLASPVRGPHTPKNTVTTPVKENTSPSTPGRRVELICLSSPRSPKVGRVRRKLNE